jgi:hypothetical protein
MEILEREDAMRLRSMLKGAYKDSGHSTTRSLTKGRGMHPKQSYMNEKEEILSVPHGGC